MPPWPVFPPAILVTLPMPVVPPGAAHDIPRKSANITNAPRSRSFPVIVRFFPPLMPLYSAASSPPCSRRCPSNCKKTPSTVTNRSLDSAAVSSLSYSRALSIRRARSPSSRNYRSSSRTRSTGRNSILPLFLLASSSYSGSRRDFRLRKDPPATDYLFRPT